MSSENQKTPFSSSAQGQPASNQPGHTSPPWRGPAERSISNQQAQGPGPASNQQAQGPSSMHGVGPMPAGNQQVQGPSSVHGVGPTPAGNPAMQGPPSMHGVGSALAYNQQVQNAPSGPGQLPPEKTGVSRRNLLIGGALVGGSLAAVGGIALAVQQSMTSDNNTTAQTQQPTGGTIREYWVQVNSFYHNLVPTGLDAMMAMKFEANQSSYWAVGYVAYTPNWGQPLPASDDIGPNTGIPGPVFRGSVGDTIRVHFRNNDSHYRYPHSMHPHGVLYTPENDGAWIATDVQPGTKVEFGQTYTYEWHVRPNSVGTWVYHDHSTMVTIGSNMLMEYSAELGMFGFLVLTDASTKPATKEFFTFLHDVYQADIAVLGQDFDCFNGSSYLGNTPTFTAKVGDTIRWHVGALGKEFHAFHLHGHRWSSNGQFVDVVQLGPANATSFDFVADNPGKWLYHCHVTDHMMGGMVGMYIITQ